MYQYFLNLFPDLPFATDDVYPVFCFIFTIFVVDRVFYIIQSIFRRK